MKPKVHVLWQTWSNVSIIWSHIPGHYDLQLVANPNPRNNNLKCTKPLHRAESYYRTYIFRGVHLYAASDPFLFTHGNSFPTFDINKSNEN